MTKHRESTISTKRITRLEIRYFLAIFRVRNDGPSDKARGFYTNQLIQAGRLPNSGRLNAAHLGQQSDYRPNKLF